MEKLFTKDPTAVLDFAMDWSTWLSTGESISTWAVEADSSLITVATHAHASGVVTAWLQGGVVGSNYTISIKVMTSGSRTDERSFKVKVRQR